MDLIDRQAAIDAAIEAADDWDGGCSKERERFIRDALEELPSTQPEIIRCKDCKYRDENFRRASVRWLPCMDVRTGGNWYCGSAERGEQDDSV